MRSKFSHSNAGAALMINIAIITTFLLFAFLIIDLLQAQRVARTLQQNADSAALAGSVLLVPPPSTNPKPPLQGWREAKRAIWAFLRANPIYGDRNQLLSDPAQFGQSPGGNPDCYDIIGSKYSRTRYNIPTNANPVLQLTMERGFFDQSNGVFYSLECGSNFTQCTQPNAATGQECEIRCRRITSRPADCPDIPSNHGNRDKGLEAYNLANATRVSIRLRKVNTFFGRMLSLVGLGGVGNLGDITRQAVAAPDKP